MIETEPFEVVETGWGEFQIHIKIIFQHPKVKPLNFTHYLKLYPSEESSIKTSKPVISEVIEELV